MKLSIFIFLENGIYIAYCPSLDLSAYGKDAEDAKNNFEVTIKEHLRYCIENDSLEADLMRYGWRKVDNSLYEPTFPTLLSQSETLQRIVSNDYSKCSYEAAYA